MNLQFTQEELDFQKEVKDWIKENYPSDMKERYVNSPNGHLTKEEHVQWQQALFSKGWAGINWPKEYGGASFSASRLILACLSFSFDWTSASRSVARAAASSFRLALAFSRASASFARAASSNGLRIFGGVGSSILCL